MCVGEEGEGERERKRGEGGRGRREVGRERKVNRVDARRHP